MLADADRFGGTLGPALGLAGMPSIRTLATAVMRAPDPDAVASYVQPVEYNLAVLVGLTSLEQSVALDPAWPNVANSLAGIDDAVVIVDVGRLPDTRSGAAALCRTAGRLLVVSRPEPASAVFLSSVADRPPGHRPPGGSGVGRRQAQPGRILRRGHWIRRPRCPARR